MRPKIVLRRSPAIVLGALPSAATARSRELLALAEQLVEACPPALGSEILLAGSVAHGFADTYSDIELNFWIEEPPSLAGSEKWLRSLGADQIRLDHEPIEIGSHWIVFRYRDAWIEAGWQGWNSIEKVVGGILSGEVLDHNRLIAADMLHSGIVLRSAGLLYRLRSRLETYPETVQAALVESVLESWSTNPHWLAARRASVDRGQLLRLNELLLRDISHALRVTFALNRRWEPEWKWVLQLVEPLAIQPPRLVQRIDEILGSARPEARMRSSLELTRDTLLLLGPPYDPSAAIEAIESCLAKGSV